MEIDGDLEMVNAWLECGYVEKIEREMEHEVKVLAKAEAAAKASRARAASARAKSTPDAELSARPPSPELPALELVDERLAALEQLAGVDSSGAPQKRKKAGCSRGALLVPLTRY